MLSREHSGKVRLNLKWSWSISDWNFELKYFFQVRKSCFWDYPLDKWISTLAKLNNVNSTEKSNQKNIYPEVNSSPDVPRLEESILAIWEANDTFQLSVEGKLMFIAWEYGGRKTSVACVIVFYLHGGTFIFVYCFVRIDCVPVFLGF